MGAGGKKESLALVASVIQSEVENSVILQPKGVDIPNRSLSRSFGICFKGIGARTLEGRRWQISANYS